MKGVLLCGGSGTRLGNLTKVTNKHLLPIYNRALVEYPLATLVQSGCTKICVVLGGNSVGDFVEFLGDGKMFGAEVYFRYQSEPLGIAHAIAGCEDFIGKDKFMVLLGDNIFSKALRSSLEEFKNDVLHDAYIFVTQSDSPERFGVVEMENNGVVINIEEKPKMPKSDWVQTGAYFYNNDFFKHFQNLEPSGRGEYEVTDINRKYLQDGRLRAIKYNGFWSDAGTVDTLLNVANSMRRGGES